MSRSCVAILLIAVASAPATLAASGAGIGIDLTRVSRNVTLAGSDLSAQGSLVGVRGDYRAGPGLRIAATAQGGSVEYTSGGGQQTESATRVDLDASVGVDAAGTRLFAGLGVQRFASDSPFGSGDRVSSSVYLPFGASRGGRIRPEWRARVRVQGRFVVAGREQFDNVPGLGDVELSRQGGWGLELSARLRHVAAAATVEPYLRYDEPAATESETVGGSSVRAESIEQFTGGLRLGWRF